MKCHKCNAENINEAVKCGMCGAKLKHTIVFNDVTGSQHVESSTRRDQLVTTRHGQKPQKTSRSEQLQNVQSRSSIPNSQNTSSLVDTVFNKNLPIEEKARIFLDSWQGKAKDRLAQTKSSKNKFKWIGFILFLIFFTFPILEKVSTAIYHEVSYQIRERTRIANESAVESEIVQNEAQDAVVEAVPTASHELEQEILKINHEMKMIQDASNTFYQAHHKLPSKLADLSTTELSLIDPNIYAQTKILASGVIIHTNVDNPEIKLMYEPDVSKDNNISWSCYSVGVEIEASTGCVLLPENPYADE